MAVAGVQAGIGSLLREWRARRAVTQLALALDTGISTRHLSFVETGRSKPGRDVLLRVGERLEIPFRERNQLLLAAGYAPAFPERPLSDPELAPVREAIDVILAAHEPNPAVVVNRYWDVVAANSPMAALGDWVDPTLLEPPLNAMRVGLHPGGLARWIVNLGEVRAYFLGRLERQVAFTGDPKARLAAGRRGPLSGARPRAQPRHRSGGADPHSDDADARPRRWRAGVLRDSRHLRGGS